MRCVNLQGTFQIYFCISKNTICGLKRKNCFIKLLLKDILFLEIIQWQVICFILQQTNSN